MLERYYQSLDERRDRAGRRSMSDRRARERRVQDRRVNLYPVPVERRAGYDRRSGLDRRSGRDRRVSPDRRVSNPRVQL